MSKNTKLKVFVLAPVEILICTIHGAWVGMKGGLSNIRDAWRQS